MSSPKTLIRSFLGVLLASIASAPVGAQTTVSSPAPADSLGSNLPPDNILSVMRAPSPPIPLVSPTDETILLVSWQDYPSIARVATPFLRVAGVRVEPKNHSKHDTRGGYGITRCGTGFELVRVADGKQTHLPLPTGMWPGNPVWAADGKRFAVVNIAAGSVALWIGDASTGRVKQVPGVDLNPMFSEEMQWMPDQKTLLVKLVPMSNDGAPQEANELSGPSIQETNGQKGQSSTYEARDTLNGARDEKLFDYVALSQLAFVDSATLTVTPSGSARHQEAPGNLQARRRFGHVLHPLHSTPLPGGHAAPHNSLCLSARLRPGLGCRPDCRLPENIHPLAPVSPALARRLCHHRQRFVPDRR